MLQYYYYIAIIAALFTSVTNAGFINSERLASKVKGSSNPLEHLFSNTFQLIKPDLETSEFQTFSSPDHDISFHITSNTSTLSDLGLEDASIFQMSGYIDLPSHKHIFFWFFSSRDPTSNHHLTWFNGGPGCSSSTGFLGELIGPSTLDADLNAIRNEYSWNNFASIMFIDQPVGVGYSYYDGDDKSEGTVDNSYASAEDMYEFFKLFSQNFPELVQDKEWHIAGESYAGHYIPAMANEIVLKHENDLNLTSIMIGNGITDPMLQYPSYFTMLCDPINNGHNKTYVLPTDCIALEEAIPRCEMLMASCYTSNLDFACILANTYCDGVVFNIFDKTGLNVYEDVNYEDVMYVSNKYVADIFPVLIYAGDLDFICNWVGNKYWTEALQWSGADEYTKETLTPWGENEGEAKNSNGLTFLRVYGAGHMVPMNQPVASSKFFKEWIDNKKLN
ncbi:hypothetical protein ACO0SA_001601 [Hanseniaspora valbyensis]